MAHLPLGIRYLRVTPAWPAQLVNLVRRGQAAYAGVALTCLCPPIQTTNSMYASNVSMKKYYTYLLTNKRRTVLYCGMTNNLNRRLWEHKNGKSKFTGKYGVSQLVWFAEFETPIDAIVMEKHIKHMSRMEKHQLVASMNPEWKFLETE